MEADAVRGGIPVHDSSGEEEVRTVGLEHPVRVQPGRLHHFSTVRPEPPGRSGAQEGNLCLYDKVFFYK